MLGVPCLHLAGGLRDLGHGPGGEVTAEDGVVDRFFDLLHFAGEIKGMKGTLDLTGLTTGLWGIIHSRIEAEGEVDASSITGLFLRDAALHLHSMRIFYP